MRSKLGLACMGLGMLLILSAGLLLLSNRMEEARAGEMADQVVSQLQSHVPSHGAELPSATTPAPLIDPAAPTEPVQTDPIDPHMTEVEIDGHSYIGYVSIPALELEFPVMSGWNYAKLKIAPCRYTGSTKTDDLVIMAHNYDRHFGRLKNLTPGDPIQFTDMDGTVSHYEVVEIQVLYPLEVEEMTESDYDLTLFTCTYGGRTRVTVRCDRVEAE